MNENGKKKREWVKTAAIVFLSVMLLLTFFSNTIMNYSLPEVATQYVQSGTITAKIRGSGVVESGDPYNVEVKESRKVASVAVKAGDTVQKGDVLLYLEDEESEELKTAREALDAAKKAYDTALLSAELTSTDIHEANTGVSTETYRQQITAAQNAVTAAENAVKAAQGEVDEAQAKVNELEQLKGALELQISITPENNADVTAETKARDEAKAAYAAAEEPYNAAKEAYDTAAADEKKADEARKANDSKIVNISGQIDNLNPSESDYAEKKAKLEEELKNAQDAKPGLEQVYSTAQADAAQKQAALDEAKAALDEAQAALDKAQATLDAKIASGSTDAIKANLQNQLNAVSAELYHAKNAVTEKTAEVERQKALLAERQEKLTDLASKIGRVAGLEEAQKAIDDAQAKVDELTAKAVNATITAPISGTVTQLNVTAGKDTDASTPVAVLQPEGKGYTLSFSVTNEQARRLSVGDVADLVNAWYYDDVTVTLANIKPDTTDPGKKKLLTFDVTGSVTAGQTLNISVGQKSANYDYIVPNSAIREDNNGKFILIVESKQGPLSTRYIASRVDVEVLASDDTQSAVSAALYGYEFVITTSTKPVEAGKQVRLSNNN